MSIPPIASMPVASVTNSAGTSKTATRMPLTSPIASARPAISAIACHSGMPSLMNASVACAQPSPMPATDRSSPLPRMTIASPIARMPNAADRLRMLPKLPAVRKFVVVAPATRASSTVMTSTR